MDSHNMNFSSEGTESVLFWAAIVMGLVALKLMLSFFVPGLKTPGELLLSALLLLIYAYRLLRLRVKLSSKSDALPRIKVL